MNIPYLFKYRPKTLNDFQFTTEIQSILSLFIDNNSLLLLLIGDSGTGKTSLVECILSTYYMNCSNENKNNNILTKNISKYNSNIIKNQCGMMDCENMADDIHHLNPQEYANKKGRFNDKWFHKNHSSNLIPICKSCHNNITKNKIVHRKTKTSKGMALIKE